MTPWRLNDEKSESIISVRFRYTVATLLFAGAIVSLFVSPMSWPLLLIYTCIGIVAGLLGNLSELTAPVAYVILLFGVGAVTTVLNRVTPQWYAAWWQPVLIAVAASVAVGLIPETFRRYVRSDVGE